MAYSVSATLLLAQASPKRCFNLSSEFGSALSRACACRPCLQSIREQFTPSSTSVSSPIKGHEYHPGPPEHTVRARFKWACVSENQ